MNKKRWPNIQQLIRYHGYEGMKRKLKMSGYTKSEIMEMTEFLFKEIKHA